MSNPKVLIACPTSSHKKYCIKEFIEGVNSIDYDNFDLLLVDNSKDDLYFNELKELGLNVIKVPFVDNVRERLTYSRNVLREYCLSNDYDYFFSLEQDIIPPTDIISKLLSHSKEVIGGYYTKEMNLIRDGKKIGVANVPVMLILKDKKIVKPMEKVLPENKLIRVLHLGLGCVMISRNVLSKINFRFESGEKGFDDSFFFQDLINKLKIIPYCDTGIKLEHLEKEWDTHTKTH